MRYLIFYSFLLIISCSRQVDSNNAPIPDLASIEAIQIDSGFFLGPCEPTICINPANPDNVIAGSVLDNVYVSNDGGKSWTKNITIHEGPSAYSDMVEINKRQLGLLYEGGNKSPYEGIAFQVILLKELK